MTIEYAGGRKWWCCVGYLKSRHRKTERSKGDDKAEGRRHKAQGCDFRHGLTSSDMYALAARWTEQIGLPPLAFLASHSHVSFEMPVCSSSSYVLKQRVYPQDCFFLTLFCLLDKYLWRCCRLYGVRGNLNVTGIIILAVDQPNHNVSSRPAWILCLCNSSV